MGSNSFINKYSDIVLAGVVVAIVGMMIVPLPTHLLDVLLTFNIAIAVIVLLISLYVPHALQLSVFPTMLLITTLFRLSLTISTTRLILLTGDAGEVIVAFGKFVVRGNFVVGAVIFLILTIVQFIVISKGSERVAEVAARFTLDAMPGKQMSIDADLRAGAIDMDEGKRKRRDLERESSLFGAMDGAMKFVKGDAIAGIIITVVNIVGGLVIGVMQKGLAVGDAAQKYTLLTIGDGLVGMIPALLISTAAGIIVTRVGGEEEGAHLGKDVGTQLTAQPKAIAIAAGMLVLLAMVPGLPTMPFLILGGAAGAGGYLLLKKQQAEESGEGDPGLGDIPEGDVPPSIEPPPKDQPLNPDSELFIPVVTPIVLEVSDALVPHVDSRQDNGKFLYELIPFMRDGLFVELGVRFPGVRARGNPALPAGAYQIQINEVPVVTGQVTLGPHPRQRHRRAAEADERAGERGDQPGDPPARGVGARAAQGDARGGRADHLGRARLHHPPPGGGAPAPRARVRRGPGDAVDARPAREGLPGDREGGRPEGGERPQAHRHPRPARRGGDLGARPARRSSRRSPSTARSRRTA